MESPMLRAFPRAILHIDGDSFFASCEIANNPSLKGKPVVTGKERGIATSMSYEAKQAGVTRGMQLHVIKQVCPDAVIISSDYDSYDIYSHRMYSIVRRYTPDVDEYSIDECFADLTGLKLPLKMSYAQMAERIKYELESELGMTFSVGLSVNKSTAKLASKWKKPNGLTVIPGYKLHEYYGSLDIGKIWGIGPNTTAHLYKLGIRTVMDFVSKSREYIQAHLTKPYYEIWRELRGEFIYQLNTEEKHDYKSISKTRTFTPPTIDRNRVFAELSINVENACYKLRMHGLFTSEFSFYLKSQEFRHYGMEFKLTSPVSVPNEIIKIISEHFDEIYVPNMRYRATGVFLMKLSHIQPQTLNLFGEAVKIASVKHTFNLVDALDQKFGKHTLFLGSSLSAVQKRKEDEQKGVRGKKLWLPVLGRVG